MLCAFLKLMVGDLTSREQRITAAIAGVIYACLSPGDVKFLIERNVTSHILQVGYADYRREITLRERLGLTGQVVQTQLLTVWSRMSLREL